MAKRRVLVTATAVTLWWMTAATAVAAAPGYGPVATRRRRSHLHLSPGYYWHSGYTHGGGLFLSLLCPLVVVVVVVIVVRAIRRRR